MSEAKTLFAICISVSLIFILLTPALADTTAMKCKHLMKTDNPDFGTVFYAMMFDDCLNEYSWFAWAITLPLAIVGGLAIKKLLLI